VKIDHIRRCNLEALSREEEQGIESVLRESPSATIFHTIEWNRLLMEEGLANMTLLAFDGERAVGLHSFFFVEDEEVRETASPVVKFYGVYGGAITVRGYERTIPILLKKADSIQSGNVVTVICPPGYPRDVMEEAGFSVRKRLTSIIDIRSDEEAIFMGIKRRTRKSIRGAIRRGVNVSEGTCADLEEFYSIYSKLYEGINERTRGHELPILSKSFCRRLFDRLVKRGEAFMLVGRINGQVVNSSIQLCFRDTVYAWLLGTNQEYREYRMDSLLYWKLIQWAREHRYSFVDLCGLDIESMAFFKRSFGGEDVPFFSCFKKGRTYWKERLRYYVRHPHLAIQRIRRRAGLA